MKRSIWLYFRIALLFGLFIIYGVFPAVSVLGSGAVPPLNELQKSEGRISLRSIPGAGSITVLTRSDGQTEAFSCRKYLGGTHACIDPRYRGSQAEVYWFWVNMPFGEKYRFPAAMIVDGAVLWDRSTIIQRIARTRTRVLFLFLPFAFALLVVCAAIMISSERRRNAIVNN